MRFYFITSIHGKQQFNINHQTIEQEVKRLGHEMISSVQESTPESMRLLSDEDIIEYNKSVIKGMKWADAIIIESSYSSTSVGYTIATAVQLSKPVIIFYTGTQEPHLFRTLEKLNDKIQVIRYSSLDQLKDELPTALSFATDSQDTRFNFFISPAQSYYLDWIAKNKKISRSVYLRGLINKKMLTENHSEEA